MKNTFILYETAFIVRSDAVPSLEDVMANLYSQLLPLCSHSILKRVTQDSEWLFCQLWHLSTTEVIKCCTEINSWTKNRLKFSPKKGGLKMESEAYWRVCMALTSFSKDIYPSQHYLRMFSYFFLVFKSDFYLI